MQKLKTQKTVKMDEIVQLCVCSLIGMRGGGGTYPTRVSAKDNNNNNKTRGGFHPKNLCLPLGMLLSRCKVNMQYLQQILHTAHN